MGVCPSRPSVLMPAELWGAVQAAQAAKAAALLQAQQEKAELSREQAGWWHSWPHIWPAGRGGSSWRCCGCCLMPCDGRQLGAGVLGCREGSPLKQGNSH